MATARPISAFTADQTKLSMDIRPNTTRSGAKNCLVWISWGANFPWGSFGENFTTEGLFELDLHIGDRLSIGSAILMVRQPRMPCYKLAAKFQRDDMIDIFLRSGRSGFYFSVEQEGVVENRDAFEFLSHEPEAITIAEMNRLFVEDRYNRDLLEKAIATPALPEDWREYLAKRLPARTVED